MADVTRQKVDKTSDEVKEILIQIARMADGVEPLLGRDGAELTVRQLAILETLADEGMRLNALAMRLATSRQMMSAATIRLETMGLVERAGTEGQSVVTLSITKAGEETLKLKRAIYQELAGELTRSRPAMLLGPASETLRAFSSVLETMNAAASMEVDKTSSIEEK